MIHINGTSKNINPNVTNMLDIIDDKENISSDRDTNGGGLFPCVLFKFLFFTSLHKIYALHIVMMHQIDPKIEPFTADILKVFPRQRDVVKEEGTALEIFTQS